MAVDEREQPPLAHARLLPRRDEARELRPVAQEPAHPAPEPRQPLEQVRLDRLDGEQRDQPDQRPDLQRDVLAGIEVEHVVEEAVVLVPERDAVPPTPLSAAAMYRKCSKNLVAMSS